MATSATRPALRVLSRSAEETRALGRALAAVARPGDRIGLVGPLGAGKTQLVKGFAAGLGVSDVVMSPTFTLMAEYLGRLPLFHLDLYRVESAEDVLASGLLDERQDEGVTIVEWAERLPPEIRPAELRLELAPAATDGERAIVLAGPASYGPYLTAAREWARPTAGPTRGEPA